jgi:hypothetical protein
VARPRKTTGVLVFLSHSSSDRRFVEGLARFLKEQGIRYWFSVAHIVGATQWHDEIGAALDRCTWFLVVLTPSSVRSEWVKRELLFALNAKRYKERIIPLLLKPCDAARLSWTLGEFQFVDFTKGLEAGYGQLLRVWRRKARTARKSPKSRTKRAR